MKTTISSLCSSDISTFALLPGHAYIHNITDIDARAPSAGQACLSVGSLTRTRVCNEEVSFYCNNKTASVGPAEFNGLLELTLPPQWAL